MLLLSRKIGETIIIGDNITCPIVTVHVCAVDGFQVRLGIDAPRDVSVHREEIFNRIYPSSITSWSSAEMELKKELEAKPNLIQKPKKRETT